MINLYGSRAGTQFTFDKIYPNRFEMDNAIKDNKDDGIFVGRYVLISYEQNKDNGNYYEPYQQQSTLNNISDNLAKDIEQYQSEENSWNGVGWDNTIWQKQFINGSYIYIKVADLNSFSFNAIDCGNSNFTNNYLRVNKLYEGTYYPIVITYKVAEDNGLQEELIATYTINHLANTPFRSIINNTIWFKPQSEERAIELKYKTAGYYSNWRIENYIPTNEKLTFYTTDLVTKKREIVLWWKKEA